jgi:protein gp37
VTGKTTIEWANQPGYVGAVWNPTTGCTRVSAGCDNCYAFEAHDKRYAHNLGVAKAHGETRAGLEDGGVRHDWPQLVGVKGGLMRAPQYDLPFSTVQLLPERIEAPLRVRRPTCYFVDSMADLFHEDVPDEYLTRVWTTMAKAPQHRFLVLTKRPQRMSSWVAWRMREWSSDGVAWPPVLPNVWLGTSVEDQASADERIPHLLATPAAVRFLSCEPLLGPVNLSDHIAAPGEALVLCPACGNQRWVGPGTCGLCGAPPPASIDWVIVGGESGSRARPMDLAWARSLIAQCRAAGVTPFVKQLGSKPVGLDRDCDVCSMGIKAPKRDHGLDCMGPLREPHGRNMAEWPHDLRIREWPSASARARSVAAFEKETR